MNLMHRTQHGFAAIAAIFLLVVLAALGGFMLTFSNTQQLTSAQDIQGSRAYWAARAGLEWGIAGTLATAPAPPDLVPLPTCPVTAAPAAVDGFTLVIACSRQTYDEAGVTRSVFQMTSTATSGGAVGSIGRIERSVSASLELPQ